MASTTTVPDHPASEDIPFDFGFDERRRPTLSQATRRYWYLVLIPVIVLVAAGFAWSARRTPQYTAQSAVATVSVSANSLDGLPGRIGATQALATVYSRAVDTDPVATTVGRQLHLSPAYVAQHVSAVPIPQSPYLNVVATASDSRTAIALANASAAALIDAVKQIGALTPSAALLRKFKASQLRLAGLQQQLHDAQKANLRETPAGNDKVRKLNAAVALTQLQVNALQNSYQTLRQAQATTPAAQVVATARSATTDRKKKTEMAVFIGLVAGLFVGLGLASLLANRRARRGLAV